MPISNTEIGIPLLVELLKDVRRVLASLEKGPVELIFGRVEWKLVL